MPLTLPNLDDRSYTDLVEEGRALIPTYAPEWTNHNPSDPGIMLLELFAWLADMLIYRQNRITDANIHSFLKLLNGLDWQPSGETPEALAEDVRTTVLALRRRERAVSSEDFEALTLEADPGVARARCIPRRNFQIDFETDWPGHISLVVVPWQVGALDAVLGNVKAYLEPRRLLTTFLHVVGPQYVPVDIQTTVVPLSDVKETDITSRVTKALQSFLDPLAGGKDNKGWPFGRNVFISELYQLLDQLPGVDYVPFVGLGSDDPARLFRNDSNELVGVTVKPHELVNVRTIAVKVQPAS